MTSFQIILSPKRRASGRFVAKVRGALQKALAEEGVASGLTQSEVARKIEIHRSVVSRELRGRQDITLGRVAELAWALGREINFDLVRPIADTNSNIALTRFNQIQYTQVPTVQVIENATTSIPINYTPAKAPILEAA